MFLPSSFTTMTVKGIDKFCKVRGLIDGFNESRKKIDSGVVKIYDGSIIAIHFRTTPEINLPH